jgi:hypothetical protein
VYPPSGTAGEGLLGIVIRNCTVVVEPDDGVGAPVLISCVAAAAFVLDAPLQQLFTVNETLLLVPQTEPLCLNTGEISVVLEAFTENPN